MWIPNTKFGVFFSRVETLGSCRGLMLNPYARRPPADFFLTRIGTMKRVRGCLLSAVLLSAAGSVFAQDAESERKAEPAEASPASLFEKLDANADGKLVKDEIPEEQRRSFERLLRLGDGNDDGELTRDEFKTATAEQPRPEIRSGFGQPGSTGQRPDVSPEDAFKRMDRNGDGKLSRAELPEFLRDRFERLLDDAGKDAFTLEDFVRIRQRMDAAAGGGRPGMNGRPARPFGSPEENFKRLDANGDGKLLLSEIPEPARPFLARLFERLSKGQDGAITQDEFIEAARQFAQRDGQRRPDGQPRPDEERRPDGRPQSDRRPEGDRPRRDGQPMSDGPEFDGQRRGPRLLGLLDGNHDGRLSRDEVAQLMQKFEEIDENGDGELDLRELFGPPPQGFDGRPLGGRPGMDRPSDGRRQNRRPEGDGPNDRPRRPEADSPRSADGEPRRNAGDGNTRRSGFDFDVETIFSRLDRNNDKALERDETIGRLKENFDRVDANGDGRLSLEEMRDARPRREQQ
ncbi:hypothetical protein GC176_00880 [bacterium]|nr:hypothetical protein [bacterium]